MEVLEDVGLLEAIEAKNFQQKFGAKFLKGEEISDFNFSEQFTDGWKWTWQVPRAEFDAALIDAVQERGVPVEFETTVTAIQFFEDESSLTTVQYKDGSTRQIKATPETRGIPVVALTAHAMAGDREKALAAGCDDFDTKPVDLERLLGKIEALLKGKAGS